MSDEEFGEDDASEPEHTPTGPPAPLDRPWVHPSELRSFTTSQTFSPREPRPREWVIGLGSAVAAVVATILVLLVFGALGWQDRSPLARCVVTTPNDVVDYAIAEQVGSAVAASVVTVKVGGSDGQTVGSGVAIGSDRVVTTAHLLNGADAFPLSPVETSSSQQSFLSPIRRSISPFSL